MSTKPLRAALYLRVSTDDQSVALQRRDLLAAAAQRGWDVVETYTDEGVSGAKGRDKRPGLDRLLKATTRRKHDVIMAWSVDRLGRSLGHLIEMLGELEGSGVNLFLMQQDIDTTTPAGRALFQMSGVFAEFERAMIRERVKAGLAVAVAKGKQLGRKPIEDARAFQVRELRAKGMGLNRISRVTGLGSSTVQRICDAMGETVEVVA